jgi:hypothetical protein
MFEHFSCFVKGKKKGQEKREKERKKGIYLLHL